MTGKSEAQLIKLFDALAATPEGLTIHDIGALLSLNVADPSGRGRQTAFSIIRALRLKLGSLHEDADERVRNYSIPIKRDGTTHRYILSANKEPGDQWQEVRIDSVLSRLEVDLAHWRAIIANTDGRTVDGKIARIMLRHFTRLQEDLRDIRERI